MKRKKKKTKIVLKAGRSIDEWKYEIDAAEYTRIMNMYRVSIDIELHLNETCKIFCILTICRSKRKKTKTNKIL